jgi:hypothetical protein
MLSIFQSVYRRIIEWILNNKLEDIYKGNIVAKLFSDLFLGDREKS